jgi:hypothetical protein
MSEPWFVPSVEAVAIFGGGVALVGLVGLVEPTGRRRLFTAANALGLLALLFALAAALAGAGQALWLSTAAVGILPLTFTACRLGRSPMHAACTALLNQPRLQGALLLALAPLSVVAWVEYVNLSYYGPTGAGSHVPPAEPQPPMNPAAFYARTDSNGTVPLWSFAPSAQVSNAVQEKETQISEALAMRILRTAPPSFDSNCHGWVFCDGHYCVADSDVEQILRENAYQKVDAPQAGDVIVYRDDGGSINHTGVVRLVNGEQVLVESKWGRLGCYLHAPADQFYARRWDYYRTERPGHLLSIQAGTLGE